MAHELMWSRHGAELHLRSTDWINLTAILADNEIEYLMPPKEGFPGKMPKNLSAAIRHTEKLLLSLRSEIERSPVKPLLIVGTPFVTYRLEFATAEDAVLFKLFTNVEGA